MNQFLKGPILIILCCLLWASDTVFRFPLLKNNSALQIVFYEHLIAIFFLLPVLIGAIKAFSELQRLQKLAIAFIGIFGSGIATLCLTQSYKYINPNVALLLQKLQPIVAIYSAKLLLNETISKKFYMWTTLSILGAILLIAPELGNLLTFNYSPETLFGLLLALLATISWGLCTVFGRYISTSINHYQTTSLRFIFGMIGIFVLILFDGNISGFFSSSLKVEMKDIFFLLYLPIVSGIIAMNLYYSGLKRTSASHTAILELSMPIFSIILNAIFLNKFLTNIQLLGGIFIVLSIYQTTKLRMKNEKI